MAIKTFEEFKTEILAEDKGQTYDYGCAMLYFDFPKMAELHSMISPEDIYTEEGDRSYGLEEEPHTTILYGLHKEVDDAHVMTPCKEIQYGPIVLHNASLFENEKYDVLKFDARNSNLHAANAKLTMLPHTTNFPDYHPHATIGYLKKGMGKKYTEMLFDKEYTVNPNKIVYSKADGTKLIEELAM
jgi:2'-5' RNA ligase